MSFLLIFFREEQLNLVTKAIVNVNLNADILVSV